MKVWNIEQYILCIDIVNPYIKSLGFTDIMSDSEEKTPSASPDQATTGETAAFKWWEEIESQSVFETK